MSEQPQILIYEDAEKAVDVRLDEGRKTVWLMQWQMAAAFDTSMDNISLYFINNYSGEELDESATTEEYSVVRQEG
ncbi:hypothetical protein [Kushneria aurantia]|uniref:Uncharacterized protein n=1 Tax=Kushneria aurantia TaxID=504092 RepID=A0ABV6G0S0_9GAMM|nr:hypothetical protein [Kushneria aurantia]